MLKFLYAQMRCLGRLGITAQKNLLPLQPGNVLETYANIDALVQAVGFRPKTDIQQGLQTFVDWYLEYHALSSVLVT